MIRWKFFTGLLALCIGSFLISFFVLPTFFKTSYHPVVKSVGEAVGKTIEKIPKFVDSGNHMKPPVPTKGIYMSACAAATPSMRSGLQKLIEDTELNAVVIDIKDFSGKISFKTQSPELEGYLSTTCSVSDMAEFIKGLHEKEIYVIGRVTVFQDPYFTKLHPSEGVARKDDGELWRDKNGISYIDPASQQAWDHIILIAKESYAIGFDEINFDYVRYPSDGVISNAAFPKSNGRPKAQVLESFFKYLHEQLANTGLKTSADLFGMTTTTENDMGIGQILEAALPYFDYIDPMVYPSHYPADFNGWKNPNAVPYDLIKYVMGAAVQRAESSTTKVKTLSNTAIASTTPQLYTHVPEKRAKLRPWLQDFSLGNPPYKAEQVKDQIRGTYDAGLTDWIMWNASNRYTVDAYLPA